MPWVASAVAFLRQSPIDALLGGGAGILVDERLAASGTREASEHAGGKTVDTITARDGRIDMIEVERVKDGAGRTTRPPLPPFSRETADQKIRLAEDAWNSRDPNTVALAYTLDSRWRNRAEFVNGRRDIVAFLARKWARELDYRLVKELWAFEGNRIAVRFAYEWRDDSGNWYRSYGNENWEFDEDGLMRWRLACIKRPTDQGVRPEVSLAARPPP
jgi:uncharacterized protein